MGTEEKSAAADFFAEEKTTGAVKMQLQNFV